MMDEKEVAILLVKDKRFKWLGGMKLLNGIRVLDSYLPFMHSSDLPDWKDPATFGCLLYLFKDSDIEKEVLNIIKEQT